MNILISHEVRSTFTCRTTSAKFSFVQLSCSISRALQIVLGVEALSILPFSNHRGSLITNPNIIVYRLQIVSSGVHNINKTFGEGVHRLTVITDS